MLAALVLWPSVAVAQDSEPDPEPSEAPDAEPEPERATCSEAPPVFDVLCTSYELLKQHYVDDVPDAEWAEAAAQGVREARLAPRGEEPPPVCALPAPAFEPVCAEIDAVDDTTRAVWAAAEAMFDSRGDPNNFLMSRSEYDAMFSGLEGGLPYSGIGISLGLLDGTTPCHALSETCRLVVAEVFPGSPAERAGLMADDVVVSLDGFVPSGSGCGIGGLHAFELGQEIVVEVERDGQAMSLVMNAGLVHVPTVAGRTATGSTGYLRLGSFGSNTDELLAEEVQALLDSGAETLVVDLRGNPGGYVETVVNVASLFLDDRQVIIQEVARRETFRHLVSGHGGLPNPAVLPIAVAVDGESASASEVLTLALRDHGRATVVGTTTYGKNTGQITQALEGPDGTLLGGARVTVFRWLGPDGKSAAGGIEPDVELELSGCWHPIGLSRQVAAAAGLPGAVPADIALSGERFDAVKALADAGVLAGTGCRPGLFCAGDPIPRWLVAVWLVRVTDGQDPEPVDVSRFADVDADQWWAAHVERIAELGITVGCSSEPARYCPDEPVTRAQMATFIKRAFDLDSVVPVGFDDTQRNVHAAAIDALYRAGITEGCSAEPLRFCPDRATTRGHMALFLHRALSRSD